VDRRDQREREHEEADPHAQRQHAAEAGAEHPGERSGDQSSPRTGDEEQADLHRRGAEAVPGSLRLWTKFGAAGPLKARSMCVHERSTLERREVAAGD
jgi:hypothetical protein